MDATAQPVGRERRHEWTRDAFAIALLAALPLFFLRAIPSGLPPYGGDILVHVYPLLSLLAHGFHAGRPTLWNYYAAGGYPLAPYSALAFYPPVLIALLLLPVTTALTALYAFYIAALGIGTYLLAGELGQSRPARLLAAVTLAYGGFVAAHAYAGHIFELGAICPFPLAFLLLRRAITRGRLLPALWCGATVGLMILAAGVQFLPFALAPLPLLALWHAALRLVPPAPAPGRGGSLKGGITGGRAPRDTPLDKNSTPERGGGRGVRAMLWPFMALAVAGAVALALGAVFVLPFAEILPFTLRSNAVSLAAATAQSLPRLGLVTLAAPNALGNAAAGSYWPASRFNPYFHEIYAYAGLLPLVLAPIGLWRRRAARPYGALALLALLVMLGRNAPLYALLYHLPGSGLLRAPARAGLVFDFALAIVAGFGLDALRQRGGAHSRRGALPLLLLGGVPLLAALCGVIAIGSLAGHGEGVPAAARPLALAGAARLVAFGLLIAAACVALLLVPRPPLGRAVRGRAEALWVLAFPALALFDLFTANGVLLRPTNPVTYYSAAAGILVPHDGGNRLLSADIAAPTVPLGLCMVTRGCYDVQDAAPLALEAYWRLAHPSIVQRRGGKTVTTGRDTAVDVDPFFLRLFGVGVIYSQRPLQARGEADAGLRLAGRITSTRWSAPGGADWNVRLTRATSLIYRDENALPRVFTVPRAVSAPSAGAALDMLRRGAADPRRVAVLSPASAQPLELPGAIEGAWAKWLAVDGDNALMARADGGTRGAYLVVDDGWFPGWTATVDGRAAPVSRADYLLRAVRLPPGRHTVRLVYAPPIYLLGGGITLATTLALLLVTAVAVARRLRRRRALSTQAETGRMLAGAGAGVK